MNTKKEKLWLSPSYSQERRRQLEIALDYRCHCVSARDVILPHLVNIVIKLTAMQAYFLSGREQPMLRCNKLQENSNSL
jgi:hypothetical protein